MSAHEAGSWIHIYEDDSGQDVGYSFDIEDAAGNSLILVDFKQGFGNAQLAELVAHEFCKPGEPIYVDVTTIAPADVERDEFGRVLSGKKLREYLEIGNE